MQKCSTILWTGKRRLLPIHACVSSSSGTGPISSWGGRVHLTFLSLSHLTCNNNYCSVEIWAMDIPWIPQNNMYIWGTWGLRHWFKVSGLECSKVSRQMQISAYTAHSLNQWESQKSWMSKKTFQLQHDSISFPQRQTFINIQKLRI